MWIMQVDKTTAGGKFVRADRKAENTTIINLIRHQVRGKVRDTIEKKIVKMSPEK